MKKILAIWKRLCHLFLIGKKKDLEAEFLLQYLENGASSRLDKPSDILKSATALELFGRLWGEDMKGKTMLILTIIQYEFTAKGGYTPEQIEAVRFVVGNLGIFLKNCKNEQEELNLAAERRASKRQVEP